MGLDEIIGVIWSAPDCNTYHAHHLRLLSVIGAQLGSYLSMVQLRDLDRARTNQPVAADDFQRVLAELVGHDLRNPLGVIHSVASALLESATDERQIKALHRALRSVDDATALITDLVDVTESRVTGTIRVVPRLADLGEIVQSAIDDLRLANQGCQIEYTPPSKALTDPCDGTRLAQIVTNLVDNALLHGDSSQAVEIELRGDSAEIALVVRNHGPAIAAELLPTIFDPFKRSPLTPISRSPCPSIV